MISCASRVLLQVQVCNAPSIRRAIHTTSICCRVQAARYKVTPKGDRPLTYEMTNGPHRIAHRKAWNSWNTTNLKDGVRSPETTTDDLFIRKFMYGTWHNLFVSEVIIKRRHNVIIVAGIIQQTILPRKLYFLIGYTEELLSSFLRSPVKLELQSVPDKKSVIYKYI